MFGCRFRSLQLSIENGPALEPVHFFCVERDKQ